MAGYKLATYQTADGAARRPRRSTTRCSTPPSSPARRPMRPCSASSRTGGRRRGVLKKAAAKAGKSRVKALPLGTHQAAGAGALAVGDLLRRRQLCRPRRRDGPPHEPADGARSAYPRPQGLAFHQGLARARRPRRDGEDFRRLRPGGLGGGARRRDRPAGQERAAGQGARLRRRLHRRQRSLGARPRPPRRTSAIPRRSRPTGPSTRPSTAPARSAPGSCRRATSATRRTSASSCGSTTSSSRIPTART